MTTLRRFLADERGTTTIEYGVIGTLISILCIVGARAIGININTKWMGPLASSLN